MQPAARSPNTADRQQNKTKNSLGDRNLFATWFSLFLGWPPCWCCYMPSTGDLWMFWLGRDLWTGSENYCLGLFWPIHVATTCHWLWNLFSFYSIGRVSIILCNGPWTQLVAMADSPVPDLIFLRVAMWRPNLFLGHLAWGCQPLIFQGGSFCEVFLWSLFNSYPDHRNFFWCVHTHTRGAGTMWFLPSALNVN